MDEQATEIEYEQDPDMPPGWQVWQPEAPIFKVTHWVARPPGSPNPDDYIHGETKEEVADRAWLLHRRRIDAE